MPNGRARSQRSRAANARRNRARGRASARRTAAAEPPRIIAILDELEQGEPDILLPFTLDLPALSRNADPSFSSTKSLKCLA